MSTVYLVTSPDNNSEDVVHGIYSTLERAELAMDLYCASEIVVLELDELPAFDPDTRRYILSSTWGGTGVYEQFNGDKCRRVEVGHSGGYNVGEWRIIGWGIGQHSMHYCGDFSNESEALARLALVKGRITPEIAAMSDVLYPNEQHGDVRSIDDGITWFRKATT